jgi:hypothetical protein
MGIRVECPKGHVFKVKDKYAGKKGLCPHCPGQVVVVVPSSLASDQTDKAYRSAVADEVRHQQAAASAQAASVLDETLHDDASSSGSLLSSSVVRHNVRCSCGQSVPMWFARCPGCGKYMESR